MSLDPLLQMLNDLPLARMIREGETAFPWIEGIHVLAIVLVVGTIMIVDLRLIGLPAHRPGVRRLIRDLLPFTWAAFGVAVIAGALMFISKAMKYAHNPEFQIKMVLIMFAGLNMIFFHLIVARRIHLWDELSSTPVLAKTAGISSLLLWAAIVFYGRWIGFTLF